MRPQRIQQLRLAAVKNLGVMDDGRSQTAYDRIARLAKCIFGSEIALITFMDGERQWFKSHIGTDMSENTPEQSFCSHTIGGGTVLVVEDAREDSRFSHLDVVANEPFIRFYAGAPLVTHDGQAIGTICVFDRAVREVSQAERTALEDLASLVMTQIKVDREIGRVDPLTHLPNRLQFMLDLQSIARDNPYAKRLIVLVDLIDMKQADESIGALGIDFHNERIRYAATVLKQALDGTTVYNVGGAYLAFVLEPEPDGGDPRRVLERLAADLRGPIPTSRGIPATLRPCFGVCEAGLQEMASPDVLRTVISAARQARAAERSIAWYDAAKDAAHKRAFALLTDFPAALTSPDQLHLLYQPRVDVQSGRCVAVEALLRWNHTRLGAVSPTEFFPLIERTDLIRQTTDWVIRKVVAQLGKWGRSGIDLRCSLNISARNLDEEDFVERLYGALMKEDVDPSRLEIEIVEDVDLGTSQVALQKLKEIRSLGVAIAIDDFGSGYSNLAYLLTLPASTLKIDRSLIAGLLTTETSAVTVSSIIELGHKLGYRIVAEGIESEGTLGRLRDWGCDEVQGFLFSKPIEAEALLTWLKTHAPAPVLKRRSRRRA